MQSVSTLRAAKFADLANLVRHGRPHAPPPALPTQHAVLDQLLPGGGWPVGAVTEIMPSALGIGELQLLAPALAAETRNARYIAFIDSPCLPYAPALAQHGVNLARAIFLSKLQNTAGDLSLWAAEQMLRCSAFGAVLIWPNPSLLTDKALRRLQLAAEAGGNMAVLYRPSKAAALPSPAALRLCLRAANDGLQIEVKKCRGLRGGDIVHCTINTHSSSH